MPKLSIIIITNITLIVLMVAKVMFHPRVALTCHLPPPLTRGTDFLVIMMMMILDIGHADDGHDVVKMVTKKISSKGWSSNLPLPLTRGPGFLVIMMMMILVVMSMLVVIVVISEMIILLRMIFEVEVGHT